MRSKMFTRSSGYRRACASRSTPDELAMVGNRMRGQPGRVGIAAPGHTPAGQMTSPICPFRFGHRGLSTDNPVRAYLRCTNRTRRATMDEHQAPDALLTPSEVAALFRVNPKTVTRWARSGKITAIRTLGGHRRFRASEVRQYLEQAERSEIM